MNKYRLYLEDIEEVKDIEEHDIGVIVDAKKTIIETCSVYLTLLDCLFYLEELAQSFELEYSKFKILEIGFKNNFVKFLTFEDARKIYVESCT
ncbi:MAG: hypothetical protein AABZ74_18440 [Cyanobacteriota bacterium]